MLRRVLKQHRAINGEINDNWLWLRLLSSRQH
jgi:hypothetical protein